MASWNAGVMSAMLGEWALAAEDFTVATNVGATVAQRRVCYVAGNVPFVFTSHCAPNGAATLCKAMASVTFCDYPSHRLRRGTHVISADSEGRELLNVAVGEFARAQLQGAAMKRVKQEEEEEHEQEEEKEPDDSHYVIGRLLQLTLRMCDRITIGDIVSEQPATGITVTIDRCNTALALDAPDTVSSSPVLLCVLLRTHMKNSATAVDAVDAVDASDTASVVESLLYYKDMLKMAEHECGGTQR
jgi:hypothetical protein